MSLFCVISLLLPDRPYSRRGKDDRGPLRSMVQGFSRHVSQVIQTDEYLLAGDLRLGMRASKAYVQQRRNAGKKACDGVFQFGPLSRGPQYQAGQFDS